MVDLTMRRQNRLELCVHPGAAFLARMHVRRTLIGWERRDLLDTAGLIASELVTNAIKATGDITVSHEEAMLSPDLVTIGMYRTGPYVVIEVWDGDRTPPAPKNPSDDEEGGRGLLLVELMCRGWGYRWPVTGGKVVWCVIAADPGHTPGGKRSRTEG